VIEIVFVVAVAENGVIGHAGGMPWRLKSDLRHFRALTLGHPVVMGRKTYVSLGRPLPGRTNIVVTRDERLSIPGVVVTTRLAAAMETARGDAFRRGTAAIMVIGGADIFAQLNPVADRLEITRVHVRPAGDTLFPDPDPAFWRPEGQVEHPAGPGDDAAFTTLSYRRVERGGANPYNPGPERQ
jgi:dihydrofolate reductase